MTAKQSTKVRASHLSIVHEDATPLNDTDTAKRLIDEHGHEMRYVADLGEWYVWDGKRWQPDVRKRAHELAKDTASGILACVLVSEEADKKTLQYANGRLNNHAIRNTLALAESDPRVVARHEDFDADPWIINCQNGTVDLKTGELYPHDPDELNSMIAKVNYDSEAKCPKWLAFLNESFPGHPELVDYYQRVFGYLLTGSVREQVFWINFGPGGNGKSTAASVLGDIMGDYATVAETTILMEAERGGNDRLYFIAQLAGKRFAYASETNERSSLNAAEVKRLTGERYLKGRSPYGKPFDFVAHFKLMFAFNEKPKINDTSDGMWRRVKMVPFLHRPAKVNVDLLDDLEKEADGIFAWAVAGCLEYAKHGLQHPRVVDYETEAYRSAMDVVKRFLDEKCWPHDPFTSIDQADFYKTYSAWCLDNGERYKQQHNFNEEMRRRGFQEKKDSRTRRKQWVGLRLRLEDDIEPEETNEGGAKICEDIIFAPSAQAQSGPTARCEDCEPPAPINVYRDDPTSHTDLIGEENFAIFANSPQPRNGAASACEDFSDTTFANLRSTQPCSRCHHSDWYEVDGYQVCGKCHPKVA